MEDILHRYNTNDLIKIFGMSCGNVIAGLTCKVDPVCLSYVIQMHNKIGNYILEEVHVSLDELHEIEAICQKALTIDKRFRGFLDHGKELMKSLDLKKNGDQL